MKPLQLNTILRGQPHRGHESKLQFKRQLEEGRLIKTKAIRQRM